MDSVDKARIGDATQMHQLINYFADKGEMLARSLSEIYENIRDYFVAREGERVIACAALHVNWSDLAEIKSVAVAEDSQRQGIGDQLIEACLREAKELGIQKVLETQQGSGTFISGVKVEISAKERKGKLKSICDEFASIASSYGFSIEDLIDELKSRR